MLGLIRVFPFVPAFVPPYSPSCTFVLRSVPRVPTSLENGMRFVRCWLPCALVAAWLGAGATPLSAAELLGLDPLHIANEGKLVVVVAAESADQALIYLRGHPLGTNAAIIGTINAGDPGHVFVRGSLGLLRVLDEPSGAPLPRIC